MKPKGAHGKSPRRPMTKEVFPENMERKRVSGTVMHKPTTAHAGRRSKAGTTATDKGLLAKGTTMKSTPKMRTTQKAPLRAKENMSTNRTRSKLITKTTTMKAKSDREMMKLHKKMATRIQRWWRKILMEREQLRQKLISARMALNELKMKRMEKEQNKGAHSQEQDIGNREEKTEEIEGSLKIQNRENGKDVDILETACFGKFTLPPEAASLLSDQKQSQRSDKISPVKSERNSEIEGEVLDILNNCYVDKPKENKLKQLSELLKSNPDLLGVTDPISEDNYEEIVSKSGQSETKEEAFEYEPTTDPKIIAALEEDLAALQKLGPKKFLTPEKPEKDSEKQEENEQDEDFDKAATLKKSFETPERKKEEIKEDKYGSNQKSDDNEPSEKSFNEYSLQDELAQKCSKMAEDIEKSIDIEEKKSEPQEDSPKQKNAHLEEDKTPEVETKHQTSEKKPLKDFEPISEAKSQLEQTPSVKLRDDTTEMGVSKTEVNYKPSSPVKQFQPSESKYEESGSKKPASTIMDFLDTIEQKSNIELVSVKESPKKSSKSGIDHFLQESSHLHTPSFKGDKVDKSSLVAMEVELQECYSTIQALKHKKEAQELQHEEQKKEWEKAKQTALQDQKEDYEAKIERHLAFVEQLVNEKKDLSDRLKNVLKEKYDCDDIMKKREKELREKFNIDLQKNRDKLMAAEKVRREKWMKEKTEEIKENSIKALEPQMEMMIKNHKKQLKQAKEQYLDEVNEEKIRLGQEYEEKLNDFKAKILKDKEEAMERERERYEHKLQQQYERIEAQFNKERERWTDNMKTETERIESFRQRDLENHNRDLETVKKQHQEEQASLKKFFDQKVANLETSHAEKLREASNKLEDEYKEWKESFLQKQSEELRHKLREMREQVQRERNEEIKVVIDKLTNESYEQNKLSEKQFREKERALEHKYRNEILELKDRIETLKGKSDTENRTKQMLEENLDITSKRLQDNEAEINQKNNMIEELRNSVKTLTDRLKNFESSEAMTRERYEQEEKAKRTHLQREISFLKEEVEKNKEAIHQERLRAQREQQEEMSLVEDKVKALIAKRDEMISSLKDELDTKDTQLIKYKELLQKQRSELLK